MISYITTAIPYVNARPHLGHALELVQADVLARHRRARGNQVRFLTGTDDNALKNVTAAAAAGRSVADFVRDNGDAFVALAGDLGIAVDDVIRTGSDPRHRTGVEHLWSRVRDDLYRRSYTGLYCAGCEQFCRPADLVAERCPEHGTVPEQVAEENWFFALSRYQRRIEEAVATGRVLVQPDHRRAEVLAFIRSGLEDFSVSRQRRSGSSWGIAVPGDPGQVIYVWWEALANYITALDFGAADESRYDRWWRGSDERLHVIGKGIVRFHAVSWIGTLLAAGESLPTRIAVHEYIGFGGRKLAKSDASAAAADPRRLLQRYGRDAVRWWLTRDVSRSDDTDFTEHRLRTRYTEDLANTVGNLINRTVALARRSVGDRPSDAPVAVPDRSEPAALTRLTRAARRLPETIDDRLDAYDLRAATTAIIDLAAEANAAIEAVQPWQLVRAAAAGDAIAGHRLAPILDGLLAVCRTITGELEPFVPDGAGRLRIALDAGTGPGSPVPAFPRPEVTSDETT